MTSVTIFGKGTMGTVIDKVLSAGGATVDHVDTSSTDGPVNGEIVVLAVPYGAFDDIVSRRGADLAGKIVVDITNPLDFSTFDSLVVPAGTSAAEELARSLPESRVLKAFNTNFAATLDAGTIGGDTTAVLVAGDDADAKRALTDLVTAGGLRAVDAGRLARARELESVGFLQLTLAAGGTIGWTGGFDLVS